MTDLFQEVEEQLRSDRYRVLARRVLPWALVFAAAALIAALGYWGWDYYRRQTIDKASEAYDEAVEAMQRGDRDKARGLWTEVSGSQAKGYKSLSLMHLGAFALDAGDAAGAVKLFDQAAEAAPDDLIGDVARLKSAFALLDTAPLKELEGRLTPLTGEGRPYRLQAREALAFAKLNAGDTAGAKGDFLLIQQALGAPESLQNRAQAAIGLIDSGSAKAIPQVVKAAQALPTPVVIAAPRPQGQLQPPAGPAQ